MDLNASEMAFKTCSLQQSSNTCQTNSNPKQTPVKSNSAPFSNAVSSVFLASGVFLLSVIFTGTKERSCPGRTRHSPCCSGWETLPTTAQQWSHGLIQVFFIYCNALNGWLTSWKADWQTERLAQMQGHQHITRSGRAHV